jgi:hypothetical protein
MTTVMIGGTSANDTIRLDAVSGAVFVTVNGHTTQYADANVDRFEFRTLGGDDTIDLEHTSDNTIFIDAGGDDDLVRIAPANRNLGIIDADITCRGGTGTDRIEFDDSAVPSGGASTSYDLAHNVFTRTPFANPVSFTEFEESKIACGGRDDFISISNGDVETEITGGGGNLRRAGRH